VRIAAEDESIADKNESLCRRMSEDHAAANAAPPDGGGAV